MSLEAISEISNLASLDNLTSLNTTNNTVSFGSFIAGSVETVNNNINEANVKLERLATGEAISTHELMISLEQAKFQLELALEVRNKLVEGYQELMRMQL